MNNEYDYCRLCAKLILKPELRNIKSGELNLEKKILHCLHLQINDNDKFPKNVCNICEGKLNSFYEFTEQILQAQHFFETELYHLPKVILKNRDENYYNEVDSCTKHLLVDSTILPTNSTSRNCKIKQVKDTIKTKRIINIEEIRLKYKELISEWRCQDCTEEFTCEDDLSKHYNSIHNRPIQYKCTECNKNFSHATKFWRHVDSHMKKCRHRCDICKNYYSSVTKLKHHIKTHQQSVRKKYQCNTCDKIFLKECILELHRRKHDESGNNSDSDKQYKCDECNKLFSSIYTLNNHKKTHIGIREHICEHCGKRFWHKKYLNDHVKSHNEDRPYKCDLCSASFKVKMYLRKHRFLHTGIKKFQCDICGKKFPRKNGLIQHSVTHSKSYPFKCDVCNRSFKMKRNYMGHKRTHTGEKPYSCVDCNKHFACAVSYDGHMEKNHGVKKIKKTFIEIKNSHNITIYNK